MLDTGEDIKWRKILAITAANLLKIIFDKKKVNSRNKNESIQSICWAFFPLQLGNLDNNTSSSRKNYQYIPVETLEDLCTERKNGRISSKMRTYTEKPQPHNGVTFRNED